MSSQEFQFLIDDYLTAVESALELLELKFGSRDLLGLWREKKIAQRGSLTDDITYQLHGNGCMVEYPELCVDFDYGPEGRTDGFDAWRLYNFACEKIEKYEKYNDLNLIKTEIEKYAHEGKIGKIESSYSNLYFINPPPSV